jgi:hypothetical protein
MTAVDWAGIAVAVATIVASFAISFTGLDDVIGLLWFGN